MFHQFLGLEPMFGHGLLSRDLSNRYSQRLPAVYLHSSDLLRQAAKELADMEKNLPFDKDGSFKALIDVQHFKPEEINVKTIDNTVIIEGKHEERDDAHGSVQRHFIRKYDLPRDYDMKSINSALSSDGVLTISGPPPGITSGERKVPIMHISAQADSEGKENEPSDKDKAPAA
jgi:crystallin alpha B